ncbi:hypothetical protein EDD86DRAFT_197193 [Gorgonomyces haynaldii]|nr:hypothetical protein EDD86DRAFT_197193 [Gorgonomyces haynaldii]
MTKEFPKKNFLVSIEKKHQQEWADAKVFEVDAGKEEKYMVTFPFPYMNGRLHLGHGFSLSKPEFAVGFERLQGKRALFPFGFHVTGMPIKACADKLKREIELFGKDFANFVENNEEVEQKKIKGGKQAAKSTGLQYQFQIMRSINVPNEEIHKFADPKHWLKYFPPLCMMDLKRMGLHVDWRRSFITTDENPFYDSFIRWQFNQLRNMDPSKIQFGERYTIYSALDGQACMDHDRSSGEGVGVQEYTGIKLQVLVDELLKTPVENRHLVKDTPVGQKLESLLDKIGSRKLFLVAATLRPETMYGQTNCYVGVDLEYGIYQVSETEAWVCTERAAKNMAWQNLFEERGVVKKLGDIKGIDLIGLPLQAPLADYKIVYTLPMENVLATKGTGVVTSVPSDSPDDYITLLDLVKKSQYYNVQKEWVEPFLPPKPIISTPNLGNLPAVFAVEKLKINSQKDKKQLAEAKEMTYKEGFYNGTITVGEYAGKSVQEAKPLIRKMLIEQELGFAYSEPEGQVISRSGDECVVALLGQWYMDYGEESWKAKAKKCLAQMNTYSEETRNAFSKTLDWLNQWACSRKFGLGSRLPWDPEWLIESLSDSTIYMAYYTVAHLLHSSIDGHSTGPLGIKPEQMTDEVWSYIMLEGPLPTTDIPKEHLDKMRGEFEYFYPMDLRCSGKDLVNNHLTFSIYNHVAIFPEKNWPQAMRVNGHLLLNNEKMSKSTGNFMTIEQALDKYGADALRFALADAGDALEDANFLEKTADDAILKLFTEREWIESVLEQKDLRTGEHNWDDLVFENEMNQLVKKAEDAYKTMLYREAVKICFYDMINCRNEYRKAVTGQGLSLDKEEKFSGMHRDLVTKFCELMAVMLSPITPHWSENIYKELLKKDSIMHARWPQTKPADESIVQAASYIRTFVSKIRSTEDQALKKKKQKKQPIDESPQQLVIYMAKTFPEWQEKVVQVLKDSWTGSAFEGDRQKLTELGLIKDKRTMPFATMIKKTVEQSGASALERSILFDEEKVLNTNIDLIRRDLSMIRVSSVQVKVKEQLEGEEAQRAEQAVPGQPTYVLVKQ